jgi:hypothetical protein
MLEAGRIRSTEKSNDLIWNQTRDFPVCSIVPQPYMLPHAPHYNVHGPNHILQINRIPLLGNEGTVASRYVIVSSPWKKRLLIIFERKKEEITGERRKLHMKGLQNVYSLLSVTTMIKCNGLDM